MSQVIDEKVVEMRFENSNFESNVNQSLSTLDKLKKSLNLDDSAKSFEGISKAANEVSFEGMREGIVKVKDESSALEKVVTGALKKIGEKAADVGMNFVKSMSGIENVTGGLSQYEQKTKAVQTIMNATGLSIDDVDNSLSKLIWFADETSYSFTDMTNNVGKFTSAGVGLEDSVTAMMGISNWAAVSGAEISQASRAMYNLSQAMGMGAVKTQDWMSIENAQMATKEFKEQVIEAAKELGVLNKNTTVTAENFRSTLKDGWFTSDVLMKVLKQYGEYSELVYEHVDEAGGSAARAMELVEELGLSYSSISEKAFKAAQEARTFSDAVGAVKDAVKSQWATLFEEVFGNYEDAKTLWTNLANTLYDIFADPLATVNDTIQEALKSPIERSEWTSTLRDLNGSLGLTNKEFDVFERAIADVARQHGIAIDDMIKKNGSFGASLKEGWLTSDLVKETLDGIKEGTIGAGKGLEEVADVVKRVWSGEFGNGESRIANLKEAGWDPEFIQELVNKGNDYVVTLDDISDSMLVNMGYTEEEIELLRKIAAEADNANSELNELANRKSGRQLLNEGLNNMVTALGEYAGTAREAFESVFGTLESGDVRSIIERFHSFTEDLINEDRIERFRTTIEKIATVLHVIVETLKGVWTVVKAIFSSTVGPVLSGLFKIVGSVANGIAGLFEKLDGSKEYFESFGTAAEWVTEKLEPFVKVINVISDSIAAFINNLFNGMPLGQALRTQLGNIVGSLFGYEALTKMNTFIEKLKIIGTRIGDTFKNIGSKFSEFFSAFQNTELGQGISRVVESVTGALSKAWNSVRDWFKKLFSGDEAAGDEKKFSLFSWLQDAFTNINNWLDNLDLEAIAKRISDFVMSAVGWIQQAYTDVANWLSNNEVVQSISDGISNLVNAIFGPSVDENGEKVPFADRIVYAWGKIQEAYDSVVNWLQNNVVVQFIVDQFNAIIDAIFGPSVNENGEAVPFADRISYAGGKIKDAYDSVVNWLQNNVVVQYIVDKFNEIREAIFGPPVDANGEKVPFAERLSHAFETIKGVFKDIGDWLKENPVVKYVIDKFTELREAIFKKNEQQEGEEDVPFVQKVLDGLKTALEWFADNLPDIIENIKKLLSAGLIGTLIGLVVKIKKSFSVTNITGVLSGIKNALNAFAFEKLSKGILMLAGALALVSASLIALTFVDTGKLMTVGVVLAGVAAGFGVLAMGVSELMTAMGAKNKSNAEAQSLTKITDAKTGLINGLTGITNAISGFVNNIGDALAKSIKITAYAKLILAMAVAIGVLSYAVYKLAQIDFWSLAQGLATVMLLIGSLTAAMKIMNSGTSSSFSLTKDGLVSSGTGKGSSGFALLGMAAAVLILVKAINQICQYNLGQLVQGVVTIGALLAELVIATRFMSSEVKISNGAAMILMATSILLLVKALDKIKDYNLGEILKSVLTLGAIMAELATFTRAISGLADLKSTAGLLAIAVSIQILIGAFTKLASINGSDLLGGLGGLVVILGSMAGFIWVLDKVAAGTENISNLLLSIAAIIAAVSVAIWALSNAISKGIDLDQIGVQLGKLAAGLVEGLVTAITGSADAIIGGLVSMLSSLVEHADELVDTLVTLFVNVLNSLTNRMPEIAGAIANFCGALISSFAEAFKDVDVSSLINALNELLFATASLVVIGEFGSFGAVLKGIGMLAVVIGALGGIIAAIGALASIEGFNEFMAGGAEVLRTIADGIGGFIGTLVGSTIGSASSSFTSYLPQIGSDLSAFFTNAQPFVNGASKINGDFLAGIGNLSLAMMELSGSNFVTSVMDSLSWLVGGGNFSEFVSKFADLGEGLGSFGNSIKDIDFSSVGNAQNAADVLTTLTNVVPRKGGLWQLIVGEQNFDNIDEHFSNLGYGVAAFCTSIEGMSASEDTVNRAKTAADAIAVLTGVIPKQNGLFQWITGAPDMENAGKDFGNLGEGVMTFCDAVSDMTADQATIDKAKTAAEAIAALTNVIPRQNGLFQWIVGAPDMTNAGTDFEHLGEGVSAFCGAVSGMTADTDTIEKSKTAAEAIAALTSVMPNQNGLFQWITGAPDMENTERDFGNLGRGVASFCESVSGMTVSEDSVSKAITAATAIGALTSVMPNQNGLFQWIVGAPDFEGVESDFANLGAGVTAFCNAVSDITIGEDTISKASTAAEAIARLSETTPSEGGLFDWIVGVKNFESSSEKYTYLAEGVAAFCSSVGDISTDAETIEKASTAAKAIAALTEVMPNEGGLFQWITGAPDLANAGTDFENLGKGVTAFCTSVSEISTDPETIDKASTAAQAIAALEAVVPNEGGFLQWITGAPDMANAGDNYKSLGEGVAAFCLAVSDISTDSETVDKASTAAKAISALTEATPKQDGLFQWIAGRTDLEGSAEKFDALGKGVSAFCSSLTGITADESTVKLAGTAAGVIKKLSEVVPNEGGLFQLIGGEKDFGQFGTDLESLGTGVAAFVTATATVTKSSMERGKIAAAGIIEIINMEWPTEGGLLNWVGGLFTGNVNFESLSSQLPEIASLISTFSSSLSDVGDTSGAYEAAQSLVNIMNLEWPTEGGFFNWIGGLFTGSDTPNWTNLEEQVPQIGATIKSFADAAIGIDQEAVANIQNLVNVISTISSMDFSETGSLSGFSTWISNAITQLDTFSTTLTTSFSGENVSAILESVSTLVNDILAKFTPTEEPTFESVGKEGITSYSTGLTNESQTAIDNATKIAQDVANAMKSEEVTAIFTSSGEADLDAFDKGMGNKGDILKEDAIKIASDTAGAMHNTTVYDQFYLAGQYMMDGVIQGFDSKLSILVQNSVNAANAAINAFNAAAAIKSPSRRMMESGKNLMEGVSIGIRKNVSMVTNSAEYSAQETVEVITGVLSEIDTDTLDSAPTIRPVVDISEAKSAGSDLERMFKKLKREGDGVFQSSSSGSAANNLEAVTDSVSNQVKEFGELTTQIESLKDEFGKFKDEYSQLDAAEKIDIYLNTGIDNAVDYAAKNLKKSFEITDDKLYNALKDRYSDLDQKERERLLTDLKISNREEYALYAMKDILEKFYGLSQSEAEKMIEVFDSSLQRVNFDTLSREFQDFKDQYMHLALEEKERLRDESGIENETDYAINALRDTLRDVHGFDQEEIDRTIKDFTEALEKMVDALPTSAPGEESAETASETQEEAETTATSEKSTGSTSSDYSESTSANYADLANVVELNTTATNNLANALELNIDATNSLASAIGQFGASEINAVLINNDEIISTISSIGDRVDDLESAILGMQVVINGKQLVGAIAGDMESELNSREVKRSRGVM